MSLRDKFEAIVKSLMRLTLRSKALGCSAKPFRGYLSAIHSVPCDLSFVICHLSFAQRLGYSERSSVHAK